MRTRTEIRDRDLLPLFLLAFAALALTLLAAVADAAPGFKSQGGFDRDGLFRDMDANRGRPSEPARVVGRVARLRTHGPERRRRGEPP